MSSSRPSQRQRRNSSKVNLFISFLFHAAILLALVYFAAREGLLGTQLKKIAVEMVKEKPPEKPPEPEPEPVRQEPPPEEPQVAERPPENAPEPPPQAAPPAAVVTAPPAVAPPVVDVPSFVFEGGRAVQTSSDPVQIYKHLVEYSVRANWNRPLDMADRAFVAEVEVSVDRQGRLDASEWKKSSGNQRWDDSVRTAVAATKSISRPPPTNFPSRVLVRFDVIEEVPETTLQSP